MTWYFDPHQNTFDLYDHNDDLVAENVEFSGSWTGDYPDEIKEKMIDIFEETGNQQILTHLLREDIKQK